MRVRRVDWLVGRGVRRLREVRMVVMVWSLIGRSTAGGAMNIVFSVFAEMGETKREKVVRRSVNSFIFGQVSWWCKCLMRRLPGQGCRRARVSWELGLNEGGSNFFTPVSSSPGFEPNQEVWGFKQPIIKTE